MEEIIRAIVYGLIQGLTEFIPISSTAHLRVIPALLGWEDIGAAYSAVIQLGTLAATFVYFRKDISSIIGGFFDAAKKKEYFETPQSRSFIYIALGSIPIIIAGLAFKNFIETTARGLYVISATLIILALILWIAEIAGKRTKDIDEMSTKDAIIIGISQALALIPGVSRSGVTITAGLFRNLERQAAARFSFLLSIPAISLSGLYQLYKEREVLLDENLSSMLIATFVSGVSGYAAIWFLLRFLKSRSNMVFIIYRIILGLAILYLLINGNLQNL